MKKNCFLKIFSAIMIILMMFCGCGGSKVITVYKINDGVIVEKTISAKVTSENVLSVLISEGVVSSKTALQNIKISSEESKNYIVIDLSRDFLEEMNDSDEYTQNMIIQCVANTFIKNFDAENVKLTCDDKDITVGNKTYSEPITLQMIVEMPVPTETPTPEPTATPTYTPTNAPTSTPTAKATKAPTAKPTVTSASDNSAQATTSDGKKRVSITFDDGPSAEYTSKIVDKLKQYNASATFFVMGNRFNDKTVSAMKYAIESGSEIAIHGYTHQVYYNKCSDAVYNDEISKTANAIINNLGVTPTLMRPIGGAISTERIASSQYSVIIWNVDSEDWKHKNDSSTDAIVNNVMNNVSNGSIILMHEIYKNSYNAFCTIIDKLYAQGYEVVSVSKLFGEGNLKSGTRYYSAK